MGAHSSLHTFWRDSCVRAVARALLPVFVLAFSLGYRLVGQTQDQIRQANELQRSGQFQQAADSYETALKGASDRNPNVLAALGVLYLRLGQPDLAVARLSEALRAEPKLSGLRIPLAVAYMMSGDYDGCTATSAVELEASNAQAHHLLGVCALKLGRLAEGAAALEEALRLSPESKDAAYTLATAYASANRIEDAERVQQQLLANLDTAESYLVRAAIQKARRDYPSAVKAAEKALSLNPKLPMANELLGRSLVGLQMHPEAIEAYQRELSLDPNNFNANAVLGWIYLRNKRFDDAAPLLERAAKFRPDDLALLFMQAQVDDYQERYDEASRKLELVTAVQPDNRAAHVLLARAYAKLKKREEFGREREIIRRLTEREQENNTLQDDSYRGPQPMLPGDQ